MHAISNLFRLAFLAFRRVIKCHFATIGDHNIILFDTNLCCYMNFHYSSTYTRLSLLGIVGLIFLAANFKKMFKSDA